MQQRSYTADPAAAIQAGLNNYIDQSGKYIGEITLAEAVTSKKGTEGIELSFKSREGPQANYLTLWTYNDQGEPLYGFKILSAIMTVLGIKEMQPKQGNIKDKDGNPRQVIAFPILHAKPIGVVLQKEFYTKQDGSEGYKFNIVAPFGAQNELTAKEMIDGAAQPRALAGIVSTLKDKGASSGARSRPNQGASQASGNGNYDDPFGDDMGSGF